jgi:DNA-binding transcriptional ArsR family regulator
VTSFEAAAEPTRRRILDLLLSGRQSVGQIAERLALSQPALSKHLRVLRQTGLVEVHIDAQRRLYGLGAKGFEEVDAWFSQHQRFWDERLNTLKHHLEGTAKIDAPEGGAMPTVRFTQNIQRHVVCPTLEVAGTTMRDVLDGYFRSNEKARDYVLDDQGKLRQHMAAFIDGRQIRDRQTLSDQVAPGAIVDVVQALSGG